jgi:hypothetical protein
MLMIEKNSDDVAAVLANWLETTAFVLPKRPHRQTVQI